MECFFMLTKTRQSVSRQIYFDTTVHLKPIKDAISGANEEDVIKIISSLGFTFGVDFVRQHPIGSRFVIDLAFVKERVALEVDGRNHLYRKQKRLDKLRDNFLRSNNWVVIRINDKDLFGFKALFYKYLIREVVEERRRQWETGELFPIEIPDCTEES